MLDSLSGLTMQWQLSADNSTMTWNMHIRERRWFAIGVCPSGLMYVVGTVTGGWRKRRGCVWCDVMWCVMCVTPGYVRRCWRARGLAFYAKTDLESAITDWSEAIRLNPAFYQALFLRGQACMEQNNVGPVELL